MQQRIRFEFPESVKCEGVEDDLALAIFTAECIHGRPRTRLEVGYLVTDDGRTCIVQVRGSAGDIAARVFTGLCGARFGEEGFRVESVGTEADR
jgi:hypothetical protein